MQNNVRILFFASLREAVGYSEMHFPLTAPCSAKELQIAITKLDKLDKADIANRDLLVAINQQLASWDSQVTPGDEIAFFPPVTGG